MDPTVIESLGPHGQSILTLIQAEFSRFKAEIMEVLDLKNEEVVKLNQRVALLETELKNSRNKLDDADQYERKDSVILSGSAIIPFVESENTHELVQGLLKDHFDTEITDLDISTTHRLGPVKSSTPSKRNIYVKFVRRDVKKKVVQKSKEKSKEKGKNSPLHANESLTPLRRKIFNALRKMKQDVPDIVKGCTTLDGKIFVFTPPVANNTRDQRHFIPDWDALKEFCRGFVQEPLDTFLLHNRA